jgi:hypothetical protein
MNTSKYFRTCLLFCALIVALQLFQELSPASSPSPQPQKEGDGQHGFDFNFGT